MYTRIDSTAGLLIYPFMYPIQLPRALQLLHPPLHLLHPAQPRLDLLPLALEPQPPLRVQGAEEVPPLPVELEDRPVVAPQAAAVGDSHEGDAEPLGRLVHGPFDLERDGRGALVQDGVPGRVVEEAGHGEALLEADGEGRAPVVVAAAAVPAGARAVGEQVGDADGREVGEEVGVRDAAGAHLAGRVRVDELLAEGAAGEEVGALGDVGDVGAGASGAADGAAVDGPEAAEDAEEGGFAAAVGADDEEVGARLDGEGERGDEGVAVGGDDGDRVELDGGALDGFAALLEGGGVGGGGELLFKVAGLDVVDDGEEAGDAGGVAGQLGDFLVGEHDAADGVGRGEQHAAVRHEALRSVAHAVQRLPGQLEEDGHAAEHEAQSAPEVFDDKVFHDAVVEAATEYAVHVFDQGEIALVQRVLFRFLSVVQGDFFTVVDEARVLEAELAFQSCFFGHIFSKRGCQGAHDVGGELDEQAHGEQSFPTD